jgi:4-amino-4-deoxy-L-arabinose transferase-like glycosyltransferase
MTSRAGHAAAIAALALCLYLPGLGREILRHPLEAKYALAAREMLRGGPLLVAHLFGELYPDKPPLYFWATAAAGWLGGSGIGEVTARLPAAFAALAGLLVVYQLGRDLAAPRVGLMAAAILAVAPLFFWYARQGHPDQFLTAAVALAGLGLWRSLSSPAGRAGSWLALAYAAMALGVLSKGLLGLILPLLAGAAYLLVVGPWRALPARLGLWPGLAVFLAVLLAWYAPAVARHGAGYAYETIVHQHVVRYADTWVHRGAWYYYLGEFTAGFFPWSLFVPGAVVLGWRTRRGMTADRAEPAPQPFVFPLAWLATGFLFLSFSTSKRGAYLLPLYPAAALLVAWLWDDVARRGGRPRWIGVPLGLVTGVAALLALALALVPRRLIPATMNMVDTLVPATPGMQAAAMLLLVAGSALVWLAWRRGRPVVALAALVGVQAALVLAVTVVRAPQYEARFPARELAARVRATLPPAEAPLSLLDDYNFIVAFYLDRPLHPLPGPSELFALARGPESRYALVDHRDEAVLRHPGVRVLTEGRLGPKRILLVRLDPG